jgi:putative flippase GtrA/choline kinase
MKNVILIPAYQPDFRLNTLIDELNRAQVASIIIVVNDSSLPKCDEIFDKASRQENVVVLKHEINKGKGRALKTAMAYCVDHPDYGLFVTVDSDGQHQAKDIQNVLNSASKNQDALILGSRSFDESQVPLKSKLGNKITRLITSYLIGQKISDTQTGLRAFSRETLVKFLEVPGERYEYEMNMMLYCGRLDIPIHEVSIETIYINDNAGSHFNPLLDSIRIYRQILTFSVISLLSTLIDLSAFTLLVYTLKGVDAILVATVIARVISVNFNFLLNKTIVFKSSKQWFAHMLKYYSLALIQMMSSYFLVKTAHTLLESNVVLIKVIVDVSLFLISYQIQKRLIFRKDTNE